MDRAGNRRLVMQRKETPARVRPTWQRSTHLIRAGLSEWHENYIANGAPSESIHKRIRFSFLAAGPRLPFAPIVTANNFVHRP